MKTALPESALMFLGTTPSKLDFADYNNAVANALDDARMLGWTDETVGAIREELAKRFGASRAAFQPTRTMGDAAHEPGVNVANLLRQRDY